MNIYYADSAQWAAGYLRHQDITVRALEFDDIPVIAILAGPDSLGDVDMVSESNLEVAKAILANDETVRVATGPYADQMWAECDETGEPVSEAVAELVRSLENYALLDETDYSERCDAYVQEHIGEALEDAIHFYASEKVQDWASDIPTEEIVSIFRQWLENNGSDYPFLEDEIVIPDVAEFLEYLRSLA